MFFLQYFKPYVRRQQTGWQMLAPNDKAKILLPSLLLYNALYNTLLKRKLLLQTFVIYSFYIKVSNLLALCQSSIWSPTLYIVHNIITQDRINSIQLQTVLQYVTARF